MAHALSITDARKSYSGRAALKGVSLELRRGEWLGLLGPNGAGKTTLIRAVAGRVKLDGGSISIAGAAAAAESRRILGVVPQDIALYPLLTARENLRAFAVFHGVPRQDVESRVDGALEWTGLTDRSREPVKNFSGGMKRRLNIAAGVMHEPEVVLLDEPTVGVDPQSRERIWTMLAELRTRGAALLLTTHQLDEAQTICERIVIIDHGSIIADGTLEELVARTVGPKRRVMFDLEPAADGAALPGGLTALPDGRSAVAEIDDVAGELPVLLSRLAAAGRTVRDVHIAARSLQNVFLDLTGRELRE